MNQYEKNVVWFVILVSKLIKKFEPVIPDTEDYSDVLADQAQCAFICTYYCLSYIESPKEEVVDFVLQKVSEAIDIFGYEGGDSKKILLEENNWKKISCRSFEKKWPLVEFGFEVNKND